MPVGTLCPAVRRRDRANKVGTPSLPTVSSSIFVFPVACPLVGQRVSYIPVNTPSGGKRVVASIRQTRVYSCLSQLHSGFRPGRVVSGDRCGSDIRYTVVDPQAHDPMHNTRPHASLLVALPLGPGVQVQLCQGRTASCMVIVCKGTVFSTSYMFSFRWSQGCVPNRECAGVTAPGRSTPYPRHDHIGNPLKCHSSLDSQ